MKTAAPEVQSGAAATSREEERNMSDDQVTIEADIQAQRDWLNATKAESGLSWADLGRRIGVPGGTLSQFGPGGYQGNNRNIAEKIAQYRQGLQLRSEIEVEAPEIPEWFPSPTSRHIERILVFAHRGRIVLIVTGPGVGKTKTVQRYRDSAANVWLVTMRPSTRGVNNMQVEVLAAMGERDARGSPQALSRQIMDKVRNTGGLIVIDEAQHLSEQSIEEIRSWHDETGVGIAFTGNETVLSRMEGGSRKAAFAQLYSRVGMKLIRNLPLPEDARVQAEAWGITDPAQIAFVERVARMPGGLRSTTMMLELASMVAAGDREPLSLPHMQDAWAQLSSRPIG